MVALDARREPIMPAGYPLTTPSSSGSILPAREWAGARLEQPRPTPALMTTDYDPIAEQYKRSKQPWPTAIECLWAQRWRRRIPYRSRAMRGGVALLDPGASLAAYSAFATPLCRLDLRKRCPADLDAL